MTYRTTRNDIDIHVGIRLKNRRKDMGIAQGKLGKTLGVTFSQIQKYENGTNRIGAGSLYRIAQALSVDVAYFYEGLSATTPEITPRVSLLAERLSRLPDNVSLPLLALVESMLEGDRS